MMLRSCVLLSLLAAVSGMIVCHQDGLGCFSSSPPNTGGPERQYEYSIKQTKVIFFLYNQENMEHPQEIAFMDSSALASSWFNNTKKTYFIIHNLVQDSKEPLLLNLSKAIMQREDVNLFMVDWSRGSIMAYGQVTQTTRLVGKMMDVFMTHLETLFNYSPGDTTLIGHGIGGHIAGIAGNQHAGIHKIVAMDVTGWAFEDTYEQNRLNPQSAQLVINLHTNSRPFSQMGFGYIKPVALIDVYVNGGDNMPECPQSIPDVSPEQMGCIYSTVGGQLGCPNPLPDAQECGNLTAHMRFTRKLLVAFLRIAACSHYQSVHYYIYSVLNPGRFCGQPCSTLQNCQQGVTERQQCLDVGHYAQPSTRGLFYVNLQLEPRSPIWNTTETSGLADIKPR